MHYQGDPSFNHTTCAVGYAYGPSLPDTFIIVHNTWTIDEPWWPLWTYANGYQSYDYVTKVIPGGGIPDNLFITFPTDSGIILLYNMKYKITWQTVGTGINHLSIWYASGYDSSTWTLLSSNVPNTGFYTWTVPPESLYGRINLAGWDNADSLVATDGSFYRFITKPVIKSPNVHLLGHIPPGAYDGVNSGNCFYLYRDSSLSIYDITDITAPLLIKKIKVAGRDGRLFRNGSYLYLSTGYDHSLQIFEITDPQNPVFCGSLNFSSQARGLYVSDTLCYLANSTQGLRIISVANPSSPYELGSYNTPGISYDVVIVDTIAIVADGNNGIVILNVKTPSSPALISTYNTPGNAFGVDYNGYLYVSDGSSGLGIIDITDPANPVSVGWYDTPGLAYRSRCFGENLFVADGDAGVRILNCADLGNICEIGYLDSYGSAQGIFINDTLAFLADNGDGGYIIDARVMGIGETRRPEEKETGRILEVYPNPFTDKVTIKFEIRNTKSETNSKSQIPNKNLATCYSLLPILRIYDATGRLVKQFNHLTIQPFNQIIWSGDDNFGRELPPGIYFVSLKKKNHTVTKKAVYLK
ncbi:MAG: T9SS type A sorting domain-containing protein [candidate division WOR-3 bacterium]